MNKIEHEYFDGNAPFFHLEDRHMFLSSRVKMIQDKCNEIVDWVNNGIDISTKTAQNEQISEEIPRKQRLEELEYLVSDMRKILHCQGLTIDKAEKAKLSVLFMGYVMLINKHLEALQKG